MMKKKIILFFIIAISATAHQAYARHYDPSTGRFLQEDPIWDTNLYIYTGNNPVNFTDPFGTIYKASPSMIGMLTAIGPKSNLTASITHELRESNMVFYIFVSGRTDINPSIMGRTYPVGFPGGGRENFIG